MSLGPIDKRMFHYNIDGFVDGVNTLAPANRIGDNFLVQTKNCLADEAGTLYRRPGADYVLKDLTTFGDVGVQPLDLFVAGEGDQRKVYFIQADVVLTQDTILLAGYDGTSWRSETLATATASEVADSVWVRESSGTEYVYVANPAIGPIKYTITDSGVDPTATAFTDTNADPPQKVRYLTWCMGRVWAAGLDTTKRDELYYSAVTSTFAGVTQGPETWDRSRQVLSLSTDSGEAITGMASFRDRALFVGMERSCYLVYVGTDISRLD